MQLEFLHLPRCRLFFKLPRRDTMLVRTGRNRPQHKDAEHSYD